MKKSYKHNLNLIPSSSLFVCVAPLHRVSLCNGSGYPVDQANLNSETAPQCWD